MEVGFNHQVFEQVSGLEQGAHAAGAQVGAFRFRAARQALA